MLHGAQAGGRSYFLYEHLSEVLGRCGIAVLRYDRRGSSDGHDVPLRVQAADALAGVQRLQELVDAPVGLWGYSQGAWAATLVAGAFPDLVRFLICVSFCGVSPAVQMRVGSAKQLRLNGFSDSDVEVLVRTRIAVEDFQRGSRDRESVQVMLDCIAVQPSFRHANLPAVLPSVPGTWRDMDYDPQVPLGRLSCPVLAFYGESDQWMPIEESPNPTQSPWNMSGR